MTNHLPKGSEQMPGSAEKVTVTLEREEAEVLSWPNNGQPMAIPWQREAEKSGKDKLCTALDSPPEQGTERWVAELHDKLDALERPHKGLRGKDDYERGIHYAVAEMRRWLRRRSEGER